MRLILVRHGETDWNQQRRVQGMTDTPLNATGRLQAQQVAQALHGEAVAAVYSSPLRRAWETAAAVARVHGLDVQTVAALQELDQGELDGLSGAEMRARYPALLQQWERDATHLKLPGGESMQELQDRAWGAIQVIAGQHPAETVVVVSHNLAILAILCKALGLPLAHFRRLRMHVAAISRLDLRAPLATLICFNDTCHLTGQGRPA
ncbi:MAG: histidine phosphatase family protein [Chloroflexi bacterium]|nr:histidine phosphatase family protein [Chloroflexota bacterium]